MRIAIHQPNFLPYFGFFDKIQNCDTMVLLDDAQISVDGFVTRNRIRVPVTKEEPRKGWTWISVPVEHKTGKINEVKPLITEEWVKETRKKIDRSYPDSKIGINAMYKHGLFCFFHEAPTLAEFNIRLIKHLCMIEDIKTPMVLSSDLNSGGTGSDRILNICKDMGADEYLSGKCGCEYMDLKDFEREGIKVTLQDFGHPVYDQTFSGFVPNLSAIDRLFCEGVIL